MAWRIQDSVIRGEIDNRQKGIVHGRLWLAGRIEPLVIELVGNACPDLAGCLLKFTNRQPTVSLRKDLPLDSVQRGRIGDLTASRKVRVVDVPYAEEEAFEERGEKPPERTVNLLYLEWFTETSGRVVIESDEFQLEIAPPAWSLTPEEEKQRCADSNANWGEFLARLDARIEQHRRHAKAPDAKLDEHDYEQFLKESDARTDKYMELLDKFGNSDEAHEKIDQEMGWTNPICEEEEDETEGSCIDELNAACEAALEEPPPEPDPLREGLDWIRTESGEIRHPLQDRCFQAAIRIWRQCKELGLREDCDEDLALFLFEFHTTGAKLAGALGGIALGSGPQDAPFTVACLKRALDHLHKAQAGLESAASKPSSKGTGTPVLPGPLAADARRELFEIREGILELMQVYRK